ncbi:RimJ/RimL family protein N-acetyltransferase [Ochrobactrum daejeonense]|uniref:RimJ/RimL family protein N-acetyltransferase n=1 Tax=Brucella daejeonensis TaxID=659015 RepID=A0A7W9EMB0_9HYPH|nr:GNAT family protein [Brucella daejeonensis]MBB5703273.1 RimJ/RimL family protein N-acetyltransferase [Brucella daejeonensis]
MSRQRLVGRWVELTSLDPASHGASLHAGSHGPESEELWRYLRDGPFPDVQAHTEHLAHLSTSGSFVGYVITDRASSTVLGQMALMKFSAGHRSIEIGYVLFLPALQRTRGGTEALFLLLRHVFEVLKLRRCEWRCDSRNAKSEHAALRLGFQPEGRLRQHMLVKGHNRDTLIFSMLDTEWPQARAALEAWLADENFDENGRAKRSLEEFRQGLFVKHLRGDQV